MIDQALGLRALATYTKQPVPSASPLAPRIAVMGGKGGVGATLLASNLALCGAKEGKRVVFVEADGRYSPFRLARRLEKALPRGSAADTLLFPTPYGVQVLSGSAFCEAAHIASPTVWEAIEPITDMVILDMGSATFESVALPTELVSHFVIVTAPNVLAVVETYKKIKCVRLQAPNAAISVLFNALSGEEEVTRFAEQLEGMARAFLQTALYYVGTLPRDNPLTGANPTQNFVVQERPRSSIAKSIRNFYCILAR